jgi:MucR family transcriptional regulator, transcriptional regulator of exopolysaccharide biosynthesis
MTNKAQATSILRLTAQVVAAHVSRNAVSAETLPALVNSVRTALAALTGRLPEPAPTPMPLVPAVPVRRSIQQDYLVCLEDGAKLKMLKRYLATRYGLTPAQYRTKWGLPFDYPMVAPSHARLRSTIAKGFGLGRKRVGDAAPAEKAAAPVTAASVFANFPAGDDEAPSVDTAAVLPGRPKRKRFAAVTVQKMLKEGRAKSRG